MKLFRYEFSAVLRVGTFVRSKKTRKNGNLHRSCIIIAKRILSFVVKPACTSMQYILTSKTIPNPVKLYLCLFYFKFYVRQNFSKKRFNSIVFYALRYELVYLWGR